MVALFVNKEEHIFDIQFKLPLVDDKLDKKSGRRSKYINPNRENYLDEHIHENPIRHSGIALFNDSKNPELIDDNWKILTAIRSAECTFLKCPSLDAKCRSVGDCNLLYFSITHCHLTHYREKNDHE